eukprot:TRINITY_DN4452_c0_g1_i9.p1 TRINITY_DN4452_c0_g1~~TRINITY_DN4452_c0_g1_i9.p1  ORF type:complete len:726 (+),score=141.55 TRINITY_DN4452_c0_g1_i9:687-2864(+)
MEDEMPEGNKFLAELTVPISENLSIAPHGNKLSDSFPQVKKCFEASDGQLQECLIVLDEKSGLKEYLKYFDEEKFFAEHHFLHAHRVGKFLPSKAAHELRELHLALYNTVVLVGVSGCGKSHAIYLNALEKMCIYLTPNSWVLRDFCKQCQRIRLAYDFKSEVVYRGAIEDLFFKYVCARYVVLQYLKQECSFSNEWLFFLQSVNALDDSDNLMFLLIREKFSDVKQGLLSGCFLAIDEAQNFCTPGYDILFQTGVDYEQPISFARFFSWCAPVLRARVVISGTALRLRDMDRLGSGNRPLPEHGIKIVHEFDCFDCIRVKDIALELLGSAVDEDVLNRMTFLLQGRPRILMNFIENCKRLGRNPEEFLDQYIRIILENGESNIWSLYGLWKQLFEGPKRSLKVNLRLRNSEVGLECDIQTCFLKILVDSIRLLGDEDFDDAKVEHGSWFFLTSTEFDNISTGLCPLIDLTESKYRFLEPLSMMSGMHYVVSSPLLRSQYFVHLLGAMLDKGTTEQNRGSYFDLFVAMKVAVDASFRRRLFALAVEIGRCDDDGTNWMSNAVLPEKGYFKLKSFVGSLEFDSEDVVLPSNLDGPDVKWCIFLFGLKTSWTKSLVGAVESRKNEETITLSLCFDWRDKKEKGEPLNKKRKLLHDKCAEIAQSRIKESCGFIRVRIELPSSILVSNTDRKLSKNIHLDIDWKVFRTLLSEDEARHFDYSARDRNFWL